MEVCHKNILNAYSILMHTKNACSNHCGILFLFQSLQLNVNLQDV